MAAKVISAARAKVMPEPTESDGRRMKESKESKEEPLVKLRMMGSKDDGDSEIFCVRHSPDARYIAACCGNGKVRVYGSKTGTLIYKLDNNSPESPTTCLRWRPTTFSSDAKSVLIAAGADGIIKHWNVGGSQGGAKLMSTITEKTNQIYAIDFRYDASCFITTGADRRIRLYDEITGALVQTIGGTRKTPGHANRVFALKFVPHTDSTFLSAGWDDTIQIWDSRTGTHVRSIYGPHICGDAIDIYQNTVLSGSWRKESQLQLWDLGSTNLIDTIKWSPESTFAMGEPCWVYSAQFSPVDNRYVVACGTGANECRVFDRMASKVVASIPRFARGVYSVDFAPNGTSLAIGGQDTHLFVASIGAAIEKHERL